MCKHFSKYEESEVLTAVTRKRMIFQHVMLYSQVKADPHFPTPPTIIEYP
jgi:hypothetical protein